MLADYGMIVLFVSLAIGASFLCSILEAVLLSTSTSHVRMLEQSTPKLGMLWRSYKDEPERPLTAILTLNTIAHTVGALGVGAEVARLVEGTTWEKWGVAAASAILTLGILLLSEILPKTLGTIFWKQLSAPAGWSLKVLILILSPFVLPIEWIRSLFPDAEPETVTRKELAALVEVAEDEAAIEEDEELVITNLLRLREMKVEEIMTPRVVLSCVGADKNVVTIMRENPIMVHGRLPVFRDSLDDVEGFVLRNEILRRAVAGDFDVEMSELMRPLLTCLSSSSVDEALDVLLDTKEQILLVQDDFGGTVGLVTMEDVIETLLGVEIVDEEDRIGIAEGVTGEDMREFAKQRADRLMNGSESE